MHSRKIVPPFFKYNRNLRYSFVYPLPVAMASNAQAFYSGKSSNLNLMLQPYTIFFNLLTRYFLCTLCRSLFNNAKEVGRFKDVDFLENNRLRRIFLLFHQLQHSVQSKCLVNAMKRIVKGWSKRLRIYCFHFKIPARGHRKGINETIP